MNVARERVWSSGGHGSISRSGLESLLRDLSQVNHSTFLTMLVFIAHPTPKGPFTLLQGFTETTIFKTVLEKKVVFRRSCIQKDK